MRKLLPLLIILTIVASFGCARFKASHRGTAGYYTFTTECLGTEYDGSMTMRAWGKGRYRKDAVEQARKEAVKTVLFDGFRTSNQPGCETVIPLLNSENYLLTHASFFNNFFKDDGLYTNYTSRKDEPLASKRRKDAGKEAVFSVIVRVDRAGLQNLLIENKIIP